MYRTEKLFCFSLEIRILEAKNIEFKSPKTLFVRYYISAGNNNNKRIRLSTKEITSKSNFTWKECLSLECWGKDEDSLKQATVILELRKAKTLPFIGATSVIMGSQLLGRAEIPIWNDQPNSEIEKWVCLVCEEGRFLLKQPKLRVEMRVRSAHNEMEIEKKRRFGKWKKDNDQYCGCNNSGMGHCEDHDVFAIAMAASMEFL
ncbi:uncharacterized protein LOC120073497 [Benincasa hispida]|uniref:uncharacterized protein LOC120073497 n=1 Tax=Benincasa hispida TaxID=102211 RepID=UPI0018FFB6B7|nr:uncharacterized protein LOC120073497 [Benincasa hispida]